MENEYFLPIELKLMNESLNSINISYWTLSNFSSNIFITFYSNSCIIWSILPEIKTITFNCPTVCRNSALFFELFDKKSLIFISATKLYYIPKITNLDNIIIIEMDHLPISIFKSQTNTAAVTLINNTILFIDIINEDIKKIPISKSFLFQNPLITNYQNLISTSFGILGNLNENLSFFDINNFQFIQNLNEKFGNILKISKYLNFIYIIIKKN